MTDPAPLEALRKALRAVSGLELLVLYGSRARGEESAASDWDFGYLGSNVDPAALYDRISQVLRTNAVDLVDLSTASGLLRFQAARDGIPLVETSTELFAGFAIRAALHWYDVEPIVRRAHDDLLAG